MGKMNHTYQYVESWNKNSIPPISAKHKFGDNDTVIGQYLPSGKLIEIFWDGSKFKYSSDSKHEGKLNSQIDQYLKKYIYKKLQKTTKKFFNCPIHFYGFIGKGGFQGIDIYVNDNYLDFPLMEVSYREVGVKILEVFFSGFFDEFVEIQRDKNYLIRSRSEHPDYRRIAYKKVK